MDDNFEKLSKYIFELVKEKKMDKDMAFEILKELKKNKQSNEMDMAIIGMSCNLPGIRNIDEYWDALEKGKQMIDSFPEKRRADVDMFLTKEQRLKENPYFTAGFLEEIDKFDNSIFKISPKEAEHMDPYQRLFLQSAFETIEDAGYGGSKVNTLKTGVFVGIDHTHKYKFSYINLINKPDFSTMTGSWTSILASRVSYTLNLNGPSMVIDSGCSSSLVAIHTACKSIRNMECSMALVGGINLIMFPLAESSMFNIVDTENNKVRPFDRDAKGTIWSEGVGSILIKPLKNALVDRDHIYAVIKGSAVNNNGSTNAITSLDAQAHTKVIQEAWKNARVNPETISYIEAHGTGTLLGDSIEISGLNNAFRDYTDKKNFCKIGSVKANIGHTVATSGIASLIKVVLAMKNNLIPASLNFENPNPYINFNDSVVTVACSNTEWGREYFPRRAGVSSFSFSGTNCHLIMEEPPDIITEEVKKSSKSLISTLSCKREAGIKEYLLKYKNLLEKDRSKDLVDICYTTSLGRGHFSHRLAIISKNSEDLLHKINLIINDADLSRMDIEDIYFGKHALIPSTKRSIDKGEITESEKRKLSKEINEKIAAYSDKDPYKDFINCICDAYVKGAEINWDKLFKGLKPKRLSLPSYPLDSTRYWVDTKEMESMLNDRESFDFNMNDDIDDTKVIAHIVKESDFSVFEEVNREMNIFQNESLKNINSKETAKNVFYDIENYGRIKLLGFFQKMTVFNKVGEVYNINELRDKLKIVEYYWKLFYALIDILANNGFLRLEGEHITTLSKVGNEDILNSIKKIDQEKEKFDELYPEMKSYFKLINTSMDKFEEILTGKISPVQVMFSDSSMDSVGEVYKGNTAINYFNDLVAVGIAAYIKNKINKLKVKNKKLKIIEIGAGTGGNSTSILRMLKNDGDQIEYYYTDISLGFVDYGRKMFGSDYKFVKFKALDIQIDVEIQGYKLGDFDIVIAANVIHGTKNLKNTINNVKKLLRPNGLFVLNEVTKIQDFTTLTFGLFPGWWAFEDTEDRMPNSPLLSPNGWSNLLSKCGFTKVSTYGGMNEGLDKSDESVVSIIVGESDGIYKFEELSNDIVKKQLKRIEYDSSQEIKVRLTGKKEEEFTETEDRLAQIWGESLGLEEINIYDNFVELGGDSIVAMKVSSIISATTGGIVNMSDVMKYQTISELAEAIDEGILTETNDLEENSYTPILAVEERAYYPVSMAQKRMYILSQFEEVKLAYNVPTTIVIEGNIDKNLIEKAFKKILERHENLRTSFELVDGQPVQLVNKIDDFNIQYRETEEENVFRFISEFIRPFNLCKPPLIRVALFRISESKHVLVVDMHHIICDGTSIGILMKEMINGVTGKKDLPELKIQYKDFACWQNKVLNSDLIKKQEEYWLNVFSDNITPLNLPLDYQRPSIQSFEGDVIKVKFKKELTLKLRELSKEMDATVYMTILAVYNILLSKYSGQEDITVGSVIAGRNHPDLQSIIGIFVNTLAIRNYPKSDITFKEFLEDVKQNSLNAYKNQDYQFEELVNKLKLDRDASRNPLFDVVFSYYGMTIPDINVGNLKISSYKFDNRFSKFDLSLYAEEREDITYLTFEYCTKLFKKATIDKMILHFVKIAEQVLNTPNMLISDIQLISQEDINLIHKFNKTNTLYPHKKTIHKLFEKQAKRIPNKIAVVFNNEKITYSQLNTMANSLATILVKEGVHKNDIVAINAEHSIEMIVSILAVLKSGCAYLPIDPTYPSERISYMLNECNTKIVLSKTDVKFDVDHKIKIIDLNKKELYTVQKLKKHLVSKSNDLAYVIYTSGSTGVPKGVLVEHRSLVNLCYWHKEFYKVTENDNSTKYAGFSFDASVWEIYPYLISGATIHIISEDVKFNINQLNKYYEENDITISFLPTQVCEQFMEIENNSLRMLLTGGDKLNKFIKRNYTLVNNYGPTENTVVTTSYIVENDEHMNIPVGKPISNNRIYIIDKNSNMQPIGLLGEVCIAGDSLARGYINNLELTGNNFVDDIFVSGEKMYKTGDLARWMPDGNIEFWGRIDSQVKVRGYRIELGEIEKAILKHEDINEAVVVVLEDKNRDKTLIAYYTSKKKLIPFDIKTIVARQLPNYMIPNNFIELDEIPLTPSGKISRKALSEKNIMMNLLEEYVPPQNDIEKRLIEIWRELLGVEKIGVSDNFFDIGGHSLKAMALANIIRKEFSVEIPLNLLFNSPRIIEISNYIKSSKKEIQYNKSENLVLLSKGTDSSKNLYMIHAGDGGVEAYLSLSNESNSKYNYWGVKANEFKSCAPRNLTVEQIAADYVRIIRQHQPEGPYHLLGWSVGGGIAFEIARQIELSDDVVELLCIIDSYAPERSRWEELKEFDVESEKNLLINQITSENIREQVKALPSIEDIWNLFISHIEETNYDVNKFKASFPQNVRQSIPNFEELGVKDLMYYYNVIRTFHNAQALYTPKGKVNVKIQYFKANESEVENENIWSEYCREIEYNELFGDHYSIFSNQNILETKKILTKVFK